MWFEGAMPRLALSRLAQAAARFKVASAVSAARPLAWRCELIVASSAVSSASMAICAALTVQLTAAAAGRMSAATPPTMTAAASAAPAKRVAKRFPRALVSMSMTDLLHRGQVPCHALLTRTCPPGVVDRIEASTRPVCDSGYYGLVTVFTK